MTVGLTRKQAACLEAIDRLTVGDVSPTYREIAAALGLKSTGGVHRMIAELVERGALRRIPYRPRCVQVVSREAPGRTKQQIADAILREVVQARKNGPVGYDQLYNIIVGAL